MSYMASADLKSSSTCWSEAGIDLAVALFMLIKSSFAFMSGIVLLSINSDSCVISLSSSSTLSRDHSWN